MPLLRMLCWREWGNQSPGPDSHVRNGQEASLQLKQGLRLEGVEYSVMMPEASVRPLASAHSPMPLLSVEVLKDHPLQFIYSEPS